MGIPDLRAVDWDEAQRLADEGWSLTRIASRFNVSDSFIRNGITLPSPEVRKELRGRQGARSAAEAQRKTAPVAEVSPGGEAR